MPLPSFFKRKEKQPRPAAMAEDAGPVQEARVRARRRLIGAVLLLGAGIVGFPLIFETRPRPMPVDIPIDVAHREAPPARQPVRVVPSPVRELPADAGNETPATPAEPAASAAKAETAARPDPAPAPPPARPASPPAPRASAAVPAREVASVAKPTPARGEEAARDKPAPVAKASASAPASAAAAGARYVVQVGAYTDAAAMNEARHKVEKLGLKTYTQEIETPSGKRTRLRVGPFASRAEADAAHTRLKAAGLVGNLLVL